MTPTILDRRSEHARLNIFQLYGEAFTVIQGGKAN